MTAAELLEQLAEVSRGAEDDRPVVTSDGKHVTLVTRYEDAIVLLAEELPTMSEVVVYKYRLTLPVTVLELPLMTELLYVEAQGGEAYFWALVNPDEEERSTRSFTIVPTGQPFPVSPDGGVEYRGSFQILDALGPGEPFVGHVFETPQW